jgi:hypothetical protein
MGQAVALNDRCCGEAGSFAVARPDIATQVRFRKEEEITKGIQNLTGDTMAKNGNVKMLTSCPACQQGLSRYAEDTGIDTDYIVVEIAKHLKGDNWHKDFIDSVKAGGIERVLLFLCALSSAYLAVSAFPLKLTPSQPLLIKLRMF